MFIDNHTIDGSVFKTANAERFINLRQQKKVKEFIVKQRGYKTPDFARMILDLRNLNWSHEKIAFVLPVAGSTTVSAWATGTKPFYEHGEALIELWKAETGVERVPREGEWLSYKYEFGQLELLPE